MRSLHLVGRDIDGDDITCSGRQVALVLEMLLSLHTLPDCIWYAGSIECFGASIEPFQERTLTIVADPGRLAETIRAKTQLLDGVFVAVRAAEPPQILSRVVTAYDSADRIVSNSVLEVRAFDTSSVEIYVDNPLMADEVRGRVKAERLAAQDGTSLNQFVNAGNAASR